MIFWKTKQVLLLYYAIFPWFSDFPGISLMIYSHNPCLIGVEFWLHLFEDFQAQLTSTRPCWTMWKKQQPF